MVARLGRTWIGKQVKGSLLREEMFWDNEIKANKLTAWTMLWCAVVLASTWLLNVVGVFEVNPAMMNSVTLWGLIELLVPVGVCIWLKGERRWLKILMVTELVIVLARIDSVLTWRVGLIILIPVVLSCRYYSRSFTLLIATFTTFCFALSTFCGAFFGVGIQDMNYVQEGHNYVLSIMTRSFLSRWLVYALVSGVCVQIAHRGHELVTKQAEAAGERSRLEAEMDMAARIQLHALPDVHKLHTNQGQTFELAASMIPAREVGGDFYNFFYTDPTHLALMIADVSGKGVPAALFMMVSKLMLDGAAKAVHSPGRVLAAVNHLLCENQMENMFVTVWLGVLDLTTGELVSANGGHEYPVVCKQHGSFEVFRDKHGMVLGGMDAMNYRETTMHLDVGDTLFVYTDGVPEANDEQQQLFGMERMMESLNRHKDEPLEQMLASVKADVDAYAGRMPQFDDTTMLAVRLNSYLVRDGVRVSPDETSGNRVRDYLRKELDRAGLPEEYAAAVVDRADELCRNMVQESGATWLEAVCHADAGTAKVTLRCNGMPYAPGGQENGPLRMTSTRDEEANEVTLILDRGSTAV